MEEWAGLKQESAGMTGDEYDYEFFAEEDHQAFSKKFDGPAQLRLKTIVFST